NEALRNGGCVAVHCISGISRSSTLVIGNTLKATHAHHLQMIKRHLSNTAFLMKHKNMMLKEAFYLVRSKRWFIRPNTGFFRQLVGKFAWMFQSFAPLS